MKEQNLKNHARIHPPYHVVGLLSVLFTFIGSIVYLVLALMEGDDVFQAVLMMTASVCIVVIFALFRVYSMQVQDRVIRAEENFRYYRLTNKTLDSNLTMKQIVALRFASDEEFPALAEKAVKEALAPAAIKKEIRNWKADYHRV